MYKPNNQQRRTATKMRAAVALSAFLFSTGAFASCWQSGDQWYCPNTPHTYVYQRYDDENLQPVGILDSNPSWFTCKTHIREHEGHNDVWYLTQGDRTLSGWENFEAWGWVPASAIGTTGEEDVGDSGLPWCRTE
ncbi:MAG: hypothetical protein HY308_08055 [Gammaproteobacteria bacterium]|nr:hypothetical protein [Gammaproteobacteria bacterium]